MDIRPFRRRIPRPKSQPTPRQDVDEQIDTTPLKVPVELLQSGKKEVLLSAHNPRRSGKKKWIIGGIVVLLMLIALAVGGGLVWYNDALSPRSSAVQRVRVTIESGSTPEAIASLLEEKGIIKSSLAFQLLTRQSGDRDKLQAGSYLLSPSQPAREVLTWLVEGKVDTFNVTIIPGQTLADIKEVLVKDGFEAADIDAAYAKKYDHPLLADKPDSANLEGYVYPETYQISSQTSAEDLLVRTFDELYAHLQANDLQAQLKAHGFNLHQAVTLASIIQKEVNHDADRRQVAQVFEKRLSEDMVLGSDVTYMYAARLTGQEATPELDSPYNTRKVKGLPPGAIANFTLNSLQAVANPAPGDYLYFVAGDDGVTHFARTNAEHDENVKQYCSKLCFE